MNGLPPRKALFLQPGISPQSALPSKEIGLPGKEKDMRQILLCYYTSDAALSPYRRSVLDLNHTDSIAQSSTKEHSYDEETYH